MFRIPFVWHGRSGKLEAFSRHHRFSVSDWKRTFCCLFPLVHECPTAWKPKRSLFGSTTASGLDTFRSIRITGLKARLQTICVNIRNGPFLIPTSFGVMIFVFTVRRRRVDCRRCCVVKCGVRTMSALFASQFCPTVNRQRYEQTSDSDHSARR